jgi:hypothetical protein
MRADRDEMTHITEARFIANHAAMGRSTPAATDRPYLTAREVLRAGISRAAGRKELAAAKSTWDSEGGATDQRTTHGENGIGSLGTAGSLEATGTAPGSVPARVVYLPSQSDGRVPRFNSPPMMQLSPL